MQLYPAIDLQRGACVRLLHGDFAQETVFNDDPADQALRFLDAGFARLHVVDLDGAQAGRAVNTQAVESILAATSAKVQLGGGIRSRSVAERWLDAGVDRVVLGTAAVRDPEFVRETAAAHPGRVAVAVDVKDGFVAVQGWVETSAVTAEELARRFEGAGVAALIVTDVGRDGALGGVNVELTGAVADAVAIPVIASGGIGSVDDISALRARRGERPIAGAVLGRSLYTGAVNPTEALLAAL